MDREHADQLRMFIAIAEACWRPETPSYSWHILDWMEWKMQIKYPIIRNVDMIISLNVAS